MTTHSKHTAGTNSPIFTLSRLLRTASLLAPLALATAAHAQAPANDNCGGAIVVTRNTSVSFNTSTATNSSRSGVSCGFGGQGTKDIWYTFTAPESGPVTIDTVGSTFDTTLAVYDSLVCDIEFSASACRLACDDQSGGSNQARLTFTAQAGRVYFIQVGGWNNSSGSGTLNIRGPALIPYQGYITDGAGVPVNGPAGLTFRLYDVESGGTPLATTAQTITAVNGKFSTLLDFGVPTVHFNGSPRWLEIFVGPMLLSPRQPIGLTPQSAFALAAPYSGVTGAPWTTPEGCTVSSTQTSGVRRVGINTFPEWDLHVGSNGGNNAFIGLTSFAGGSARTWTIESAFDGSFRVADQRAAAMRMLIDINGTCFNRFGAWATLSDERKKHDIVPLTSALDTISAIETIRFQYNDDAGYLTTPGVKMGFRAQNLEKILPEWVQTTDDGTKVVVEQGATALTVAALRELRAEKDAQIAALKADVAAKDAALADLAARLARLENAINPAPTADKP